MEILLREQLPCLSSHGQQREHYLKEGPLLIIFFKCMYELNSQSILRWTGKPSLTIKESEAYNVMYLAAID